PLIHFPYLVASFAARDAYDALYDAQNEVACLMLGIKAFRACKQEDGQPVSSYLLKMKSYLDILERLGYAMPNELGVFQRRLKLPLFKLYGRVRSIRTRRSHGGQRVRTRERLSKGKTKLAYAPKPKISPPPKRDNPAKESVCHHCHEVGHQRRNCSFYHAELKKRKNASIASISGS
ncbi:zinc finger, CCHC-type containing protein, partial [Tanacetum coccineum]